MEMLDTLFGGEMSTAVQLILITIALIVGLLVYLLDISKIKRDGKLYRVAKAATSTRRDRCGLCG